MGAKFSLPPFHWPRNCHITWSQGNLHYMSTLFEARSRIFLPTAQSCAALFCCRLDIRASSLGWLVGNYAQTEDWTYQGRIQDFFMRGCTRLLLYFNTNKPHTIVFFLQNTSCIRKPQVISGGVRTPCTLPIDPPLLIADKFASFWMFPKGLYHSLFCFINDLYILYNYWLNIHMKDLS